MRNILVFCVFAVLSVSATNTQAVLPNPLDSAIQHITDQRNNDGGEIYDAYDGGFSDTALVMGFSSDDTVILYVNGVMNDKTAFLISLNALKGILPEPLQDAPVYGFYNVSRTEHVSEIAKYLCPLAESGVEFFASSEVATACSWYEGAGATADLAEAGLQILQDKLFQNLNFVDAEAVTRLKDTLRLTVESGKRVIIVAHSQGNLFVRDALQELLKEDPEDYGERISKSIGVIMVGSPAKQSSMPGKSVNRPGIGYDLHEILTLLNDYDTRGGSYTAWVGSCKDLVAHTFGREPTYCSLEIGYMLDDITWFDERIFKSGDRLITNTLLTPSNGYHLGENTFRAIANANSTEFTCVMDCPVSKDVTLADHYFGSYLKNEWLDKMVETLLKMNDSIYYPARIFQIDDYIVVGHQNGLNVRTSRLVDDSTKKYAVVLDSTGRIADQGMFADGYYWYWTCFDSGTISNPADMPDGNCGYVASNYLKLDFEAFPLINNGALVPIGMFEPEIQVLEQAPIGMLTVAGGLTLPSPDTSDSIAGMGGCTDCSNSAPSQFEMTASTISCSANNTGGNAVINWDTANGATSYNVYRDGELVVSGLTSATYTDNAELTLGKTYLYFVKALNANGSRNADNSWYPEISTTLCGDPEPPAPYAGNVPTVSTMGVSDLEVGSARLHEIVNPNGVAVNTYFEYGETESLGFSTSMISQGAGTSDVEFDYPVLGLTCNTTYHYRVAGEYFGNETSYVYGDTLSFSTPECASSPPSNLAVEHDVANDVLVFSWDEPIISYQSAVLVERKIVSDPRPGITLGTWEYLASQSPKYETFSDKWLSPQVGAEYCYRIRTWNIPAGSTGYSNYSNEICMSIEGVFVQQVDFPQGPWPNTKPGQGIEVVAVGGQGVFNIERRYGSNGYATVGNVDSYGGINWMDSSVTSGENYCYRFEQSGLKSVEACNTYVDVATVGIPVLLSLTDVDVPPHGANSVHLEWDSNVTDQGYYEVLRYGLYGGTMQWYNGPQSVSCCEVDTVKLADFDDTNVCFKVRQNIHGVRSEYSNELCISETKSSVVYDTTPTLILTGGDITLELGDVYIEPGFTATDYLNRDITSSVIVTGSVDTGMVGAHTLTYDVADLNGTNAVQVTRMIEVIFNSAQAQTARDYAVSFFSTLSDVNGNGKPEILTAVEDSATIFKVRILDVDTGEEIATITPIVQ